MWRSEQDNQVVPIDHRRKVMKAQRMPKSVNRRGSFQQPLVDYLNHSLSGQPSFPQQAIQAHGRKAYLRTTIQVFPSGSSPPQPPVVHQPESSQRALTDYHDQDLAPKAKEKRPCFLFRKKKPKTYEIPSEKYVPLKYKKPPKDKNRQVYSDANDQIKEKYYKPPKMPKEPKIKTKSEKQVAYQKQVRDSFSFIYTSLLATLFILVNLACIVLQVILFIRKSAYYDVYAGFWASGYNILVGFFSYLTICCRHYKFLISVTVLKFISIIVSLVGLIVFSILPINFFSNCPTNKDANCSTIENRPLNWAMLGLGIASTILAGLYVSYVITVLSGKCSRKSKQQTNTEMMDFNQNPYPYNNNNNNPYYQQQAQNFQYY